MITSNRQRQQFLSRHIFFSASKRSYATAAILWSTRGWVPGIVALTMPNSRNRTTTMTYATNSLVHSLTSFDEETYGGIRNLSSYLIWHHLTEPIGSTQDEARKLLQQYRGDKALAVLADIQLEGRGTQGRKWESQNNISPEGKYKKDGNLYLTICIPLDKIPVTITLLPLQVGVFVADRVSQLIDFCRNVSAVKDATTEIDYDGNAHSQVPYEGPLVSVKWPNDVLVDHRKISGTLIETESVSYDEGSTYPVTWMLIGIGMNIASAPRNLSTTRTRPGKHIRPACCVYDFCSTSSDGFGNNNHDGSSTLPQQTAVVLGQDLASAIADWVFGRSSLDKQNQEKQLLEQWNSYAEWGQQYELRGRVVDEEQGGYIGEKVTTVKIEHDGQLRVRGADGRERLLVADYLF
jgi:BirA family transcriptional regulator, biotin operon repressor / biotin---[acetyl-CoA-carboxylase] ligase